jgi:hypothetical protein
MATWIKTDGTETTVSPKGRFFCLEELQQFVGGWIELAYTHAGRQMFLNEEGKLRDLPLNLKATILYQYGILDPIVGDVVVLDESEEEKEDEE